MSSTEQNLVVAVDVGGTFTDITLTDIASGRITRAKTPSTPHDPSEAFLTGLHLALSAADARPSAIGRVLHGTTVATNLILEGKGAHTVLITTRGFRHVLEIGRQDIPRAANLYVWIKPPRPVPPRRVLEVTERIAADGSIMCPLDEADVQDVAETCRRCGAEAVAICLLHSFANPAHERRVAALLRAALPDVAVTASVDVLPVVREYERSVATILNARIMPAVSTYVERLEQRLVAAGISAPLLLMQSNGGVAGAAAIRRAPAVTALSGPAAGVVGARDVAAAAGFGNLITVDIGGTSADICLMRNGRIELTHRGRVGNWPLPLPMVDMVTIGAGGGSLAQIEHGALLVGPISAGARPGPACYGQGGERPTVTDAHVVLGHLPTSLLGGGMTLDFELARKAILAHVAEPLGLSLHAAARGILAIADSNMIGAIRVVSVERGHDPRGFALVAFGGAGPLHGCALAEMLDITIVLVPSAPGVLCAEGLLAAHLRAEFSRSVIQSATLGEDGLTETFNALQADAQAWLDEEAVPQEARRTAQTALMCYEGQGSELPVAWAGDILATAAAFEQAHQTLYGFTLDTAVRLITIRVEAEGVLHPPVHPLLPVGRGARPNGQTQVHFNEGSLRTDLYDRARMGAGDQCDGPAIVTQLDATTLLRPGWSGTMHETGVLVLQRSISH
ncbi:hydantoinase/oxoprolinase family protein [Rhodopila sp.]|uniref:hydantoinase/oxoprolinase family protein n=1 Tax=Rhodopila sp. TaxID=2480087 RepID=UPI003D12F0BD